MQKDKSRWKYSSANNASQYLILDIIFELIKSKSQEKKEQTKATCVIQ